MFWMNFQTPICIKEYIEHGLKLCTNTYRLVVHIDYETRSRIVEVRFYWHTMNMIIIDVYNYL